MFSLFSPNIVPHRSAASEGCNELVGAWAELEEVGLSRTEAPGWSKKRMITMLDCMKR